jgi:hypothetical protein
MKRSPQYRYETMLRKLRDDDHMLNCLVRDNEDFMNGLAISIQSRVLYFKNHRELMRRGRELKLSTKSSEE